MAKIFKNDDHARQAARELASQVFRPIGIELDRLPDPESVAQRSSRLWEAFRAYRASGLHRMFLPGAFGGCRDELGKNVRVEIMQLLGHGDAGLAISIAAGSMPFFLGTLCANPKVRKLARAYAEDMSAELLGCWGITEPDHGSDWVIGTTPRGKNAKLTPRLRGVRDGSDYILNGQKSAWVSNGTIATHAVLHVSLDPSLGMHGQGIAFCPLDLRGISRGKPLNKLGQRPLNQGELIFEDVRLPADHFIIGNPAFFAFEGVGRSFLGEANRETGIMMSGLARAAFDETLDFARKTPHGNATLFDQEQVRLKLFQMFAQVEAANSLARHAGDLAEPNPMLFKLFGTKPGAVALAHGVNWVSSNFDKLQRGAWLGKSIQPRYNRGSITPRMLGIACKIMATDTAFRVASDGMQIFGAAANDTRYPIEKLLRDARASLIEDGTNEALALAASEDLRHW